MSTNASVDCIVEGRRFSRVLAAELLVVESVEALVLERGKSLVTLDVRLFDPHRLEHRTTQLFRRAKCTGGKWPTVPGQFTGVLGCIQAAGLRIFLIADVEGGSVIYFYLFGTSALQFKNLLVTASCVMGAQPTKFRKMVRQRHKESS